MRGVRQRATFTNSFARMPLRLSLLYLSYYFYLHCMHLYELRHAHLRRARACPVVCAPLSPSVLELEPSALRLPRACRSPLLPLHVCLAQL